MYLDGIFATYEKYVVHYTSICSATTRQTRVSMGVYTMSLSTSSLIVWIWLESSLFSLVVMLAAMTGLVTPHARPSAAFELTKMYGTFCNMWSNRERSAPRT